MNKNINQSLELLCTRYPELKCVQNEIFEVYLILKEMYANGGKLLIAGNGTYCWRINERF